jgi:hypothetical protein
MERKNIAFLSLIIVIVGGVIYAINQPSFECKSVKNVAEWHWDRAETANSLSTEPFLSSIFGDIQNTDVELKYKKSIYELRRIEHLYKISASNLTLENPECFSRAEIIKATTTLQTQKSFEEYFAY